MQPDDSLRTRKRAETRERIHKAAMQLFAAQGFAGTTIKEIAARADVSQRTVFVHYPTKEDLLFGDIEAGLASLDAVLRARPDGMTVIEGVRGWISHVATGWLEPDLVIQMQLLTTVSSIAERRAAVVRRFVPIISAAFAQDLGEAPDDVRPRLAAVAVVEGLSHLEMVAAERIAAGHPAPSADEVAAILSDVATFIERGLGTAGPAPGA